VKKLDFMTDREFHPIFDRVSRKVHLKGAGSPAEINKRLTKKVKKDEEKIAMIDEAIIEGYAKAGPLSRWKKKIRNDIKDTKQLIFAGFGRRTINEAIARPRERVALTLKYGRTKAKEILLQRARERLGSIHLRRHRKRR
jgi:regulator of extracellular matrix RemA (YlzA/DUF370 family)